jgi:hypothetical protein
MFKTCTTFGFCLFANFDCSILKKKSTVLNLDELYSLRFHIRSRLGQRHSHQNTILTSLLYKNIYWKVIYVYSYENYFQDKSII